MDLNKLTSDKRKAIEDINSGIKELTKLLSENSNSRLKSEKININITVKLILEINTLNIILEHVKINSIPEVITILISKGSNNNIEDTFLEYEPDRWDSLPLDDIIDITISMFTMAKVIRQISQSDDFKKILNNIFKLQGEISTIDDICENELDKRNLKKHMDSLSSHYKVVSFKDVMDIIKKDNYLKLFFVSKAGIKERVLTRKSGGNGRLILDSFPTSKSTLKSLVDSIYSKKVFINTLDI